jgi:hypothetical protein
MTTSIRNCTLGGAAAVVLCAVLSGGRPVSLAAEPGEGTITSARDEVTWSGGPFFASNPAGCLGGAADPTCDHFVLRIENPRVQRVLVAISPDEGFEDDDYDLFVYDDRGNLMGSDADGDGFESVVFENTGAAFYEVRVQPWLVDAGSTYHGVAMRTREPVIDTTVQDCNEFVPAAASLDLGQPIDLTVMLLLDGTDAAVAKQLMARAAFSYSQRNIRLVLKRTRAVSFVSTTSEGLIEEAKAFVGGVRPQGIDIVGTLTNKQMQSIAAGFTVVGQADCIGGIRYPDRSFFVATDIRAIEDPQTGNSGTLNQLGFNPNVAAAAEVLSHEMGHLMGAHHHYANCVEGNLSSDGPNDLSPCTLMFNSVNFAGLSFSALEGSVVRGHAANFAAP